MARAYLYAESIQAASELVSLAQSLGQESVLFAIGDSAGLEGAGADKVVVLKGESHRAEDYAQAIAKIVGEEPGSLFAVSSTCRGRELAAKVAAQIGCGMASDASFIERADEGFRATRTVYGGAVVNTLMIPGTAVATVMAGAYDAQERSVTATVETREVFADTRVKVVSTESIPKGDVDLTQAERVVGVGLGLDKREDLALIQELADVLGAGIGCSRDFAEGRGWLPKEQYIGITGVAIKPQLYLAVGISGAMQHTYGIRDAKIVVGVNKEKSAPIFRAADYGIVGDLYEVVPKLIDALRGN